MSTRQEQVCILINKLIFMVWFIIPVIAGCSMFSAAPVQEVKGDNVVLVLYKNKGSRKKLFQS